MFRGTMFSFVILMRLVRFFSLANEGSVRVSVDWGALFMYKEILSDHCPFVNYEWRGSGVLPRKNLISLKQNRVIFRKFGT